MNQRDIGTKSVTDSIAEMCSIKKQEFGIDGYSFNPKLRFNFNISNKIPLTKKNTYLDQIAKDKSKIPAPSKYECTAHRKNFNDINKKSKIYMMERKSYMNDIFRESKKSPGPGKYDSLNYDEKRERPPRGVYKVKDMKITHTDEIINTGNSNPGMSYPTINLNKIKPRPYMQVGYFKESAKEIEAKKFRKNDNPSPVSYKVSEAREFASGEKYQDKSGRYYKIGKCKKNLFTEDVIAKAKKSPGVGQYKYE